MPIVISIISNLIVIYSAYTLTYKLLKIKNPEDSVAACFLLYISQIISTELVLGIAGILTLKNLILSNIVIMAVLSFLARDKSSSFNSDTLKDSFKNLLSDKILFFAFCVIFTFGAVKIFINLINPPFGWDSLNYHFTFAVEWLKHGNLNNPITVFDDPSPTYYPINGSLYYLWLMLPLKNVFLADLGQIPFFILAVTCVYSIARKINLSREYSCFAAMLYLLIPNFFKHMQLAYVDAMVAALFLCAVNALFLLSKEFSLKNAILFSVSTGLFLGTKTIALPYSILLFIPFIYFSSRSLKKIYIPVISLLIIVALGGFSYIRNLIETGNPLYPFDLNLFGRNIFKGVMTKAVYSAHFRIQDYAFGKMFFHEGLGLQTLIFFLPGIILSLPVTWKKNKKQLDFFSVYFLFLPVLLYLIYRFIIPLANTRYLYAGLGLGMILGSYVYEKLKTPKPLINTLILICVISSMAELAKRTELIISVILSIALFASVPLIMRQIKKYDFSNKRKLALIICAILTLVFLEHNYVKNEFPRYQKMVKYSGFWPDAAKAWDWLNNNTRRNNIAYAGRPVPFPLYGTNFKNKVYYVSVNATEPAKLHFFPDSRYFWDADFLNMHKNFEAIGNYRGFADADIWLFNLLEKRIDYLFIYSLHQTKELEFPIEDTWAKNKPEIFNLDFSNETIHIYKITR